MPKTDADRPGLHLHLEPLNSIELPDMLASLGTVGRRYERFRKSVLDLKGDDGAKLYVSSVKPGSIDISLVPDLIDFGLATSGVLVAAGPRDAFEAVASFGRSLETLLDRFNAAPPPADGVTIRDCDDVINIAGAIAKSGGEQTISVNNVGGDQVNILVLRAPDAERMVGHAATTRAILQMPTAERRNGMALIWKTFDRSPGRTEGQRSPDKGIIAEIDEKPKSVLFVDDEAGLKADILADDANPMLMVYYVDVEIVRVNEKITAYRVVGYDGKDPMEVGE